MGNGQSSSVTKLWQTETAPLPSPGPSHPRPPQEGPSVTLSKESEVPQDTALSPCTAVALSPAGQYGIQFIEHLAIFTSPPLPPLPPANPPSPLEHSLASFLPPCLQPHSILLREITFYHTQSLVQNSSVPPPTPMCLFQGGVSQLPHRDPSINPAPSRCSLDAAPASPSCLQLCKPPSSRSFHRALSLLPGPGTGTLPPSPSLHPLTRHTRG